MTTSLLLGVAGAGVGAYFHAPGLGYAIGSSIGAAIDARYNNVNEHTYQQGPRLNDLRIQGSSYGSPIPIHFGRNRLAGTIIWAAPIAEHSSSITSHTRNNKHSHAASVTQTTYSYTASFAILLCRGVVSGFGRIWLDGNLFYDARGLTVGSLYAGSAKLGALTFYYGNETQLPDPTMEAYQGYGNVPAYRGSAYIVFRDLQVDTFGGRIPNVTVEVFKTGEPQNGRRFPDSAGEYDWGSPDSGYSNVFTAIQQGVLRVLNQTDKTVRLLNTSGALIGYAARDPEIDKDNCTQNESCGCLNGQALRTSGVFWLPFSGIHPDTKEHEAPPQILTEENVDLLSIVADKSHILIGFSISADQQRALIITGQGKPWSTSVQSHTWYLVYLSGDKVIVEASGSAAGLHDADVCSFGVGNRTSVYIDAAWAASTLENDYQHFWIIDFNVRCYRLSPEGIMLVFSAAIKEDYADHSVIADHGMCWVLVRKNVCSYTRLQLAAAENPLLAEVISDICQLSNLTADEMDTNLLTENITGYTISRQSTLRAALQQLMNAYFLDAVESDGKLKFVPRSSEHITVLQENDVAVHAEGEALPDIITIKRQQELELPKRVTVTYITENADYQTGSQYAARIQVNSINETAIELPLVLSDSKAAQIADAFLYEQWLGRETYQVTVGMEYLFLEPGDVVTIKTTNAVFYARLISVEIGSPGILVLQGVAHDAVVYASTVKGAAITVAAQSLEPAGPTELRLLDIPLLRSSDNEPGFYVAACGHYVSWKGASLLQSVDGCAWSQVKIFNSPAVMGIAINALQSGLTTIPDLANSVRVTLLQGGELASITDERFLAGENLALIGSEIIQFRDAVLQGDGSYKLSFLLRGRFGTEWAMIRHKTHEEFTLLTEDTLQRVVTDLNSINTLRTYKAVTLGTSPDEVNGKKFTNHSVGLKPYAPVHVSATRDDKMNITFHWIRRTRMSGEWRDKVDVPLGEVSEAYEVDILNNKSVIRTLTSAEQSVIYTIEQQNTDKITKNKPVHIKIYQLSAVVGRGFPAELLYDDT